MKFPEQFRRSFPGYESGEGNPFGAFQIPGRHACGRMLNIIACDGVETGWEHVSVSIMGSDKCPSWTEMCCVKELFWDDEETVIQLHPPKQDWISNHPGCLHLWRCVAAEQPLPDSVMVGLKELNV